MRATLHAVKSDTQLLRPRRVPLREPIRLWVDGDEVAGVAVNLSDGGLAARLDTSVVIRPDAVVRLRVRLPHQPEPIDVTARLAWSVALKDAAGAEVGLRFEADQAHAHAALESYLSTFRYRVLVVGVREPDAATVAQALGEAWQPEALETTGQVAAALLDGAVGLVVVDDEVGVDEVAALVRATAGPPAVPLVVLTQPGLSQTDGLLRAEPRLICVPKGQPAHRLAGLLFRCAESFALTVDNERMAVEVAAAAATSLRERERVLRSVAPTARLGGFIGASKPMQAVYEAIERLARVDTAVFVLGETGTGKGLVARAIHAASQRSRKPFVVQNCAALAESLLDSELFGHSKGAFTGAVADRAGLFETANGGTVFLDEIGEMSAAMQAKLLNVLQDGEVRRVGAAFPTRVDVRVVCASHRNLAELVRSGAFREDLYYRLVNFVLRLPPLEARPEDIRALAEHFLAQFTARNRLPALRLGASSVAVLEHARWPGNVRQLQHCVERMALAHTGTGVLTADDAEAALALVPAVSPQRPSAPSGPLAEAVDAQERAMIDAALQAAGGVIADAARALGVERSTLSRRVKRLGLRPRS